MELKIIFLKTVILSQISLQTKSAMMLHWLQIATPKAFSGMKAFNYFEKIFSSIVARGFDDEYVIFGLVNYISNTSLSKLVKNQFTDTDAWKWN